MGAAQLKTTYKYQPSKTTGTYSISSELLYSGDMSNGKPNGNGVVFYISTRSVVYCGDFKDGRYHGNGKLYQNGLLYEEGVFENGMIKEGVRYDPKGFVYSGGFRNDIFDGMGRIVLPSGFFISCFFSNGTPVNQQGLSVTVSIPSGKDCSSSFMNANMGVSILHDAIIVTETSNTCYAFYFNGDVFMGEMDRLGYDDAAHVAPKNGVMYKYNVTDFIPMIVGNGQVNSKYKAPKMEKDREGFKYFCLKC